MKRRNFLIVSGLGVSAIAIPTWYYNSLVPDYDQLLTEPELLAHIWDDTTIIEVGKAYMKQFPNEKSERKLVLSLSIDTVAEQTTSTEMLRQQIASDFNNGNLVTIDGWILSRTEARQCALFSLTQ